MTTDSPIDQPSPPRAGDGFNQRRVYFEHLSNLLLSSGMAPDRVGALVAELDEHVALTGNDPVDELGPAGELARELRLAAGDPGLSRRCRSRVVPGSRLDLEAIGPDDRGTARHRRWLPSRAAGGSGNGGSWSQETPGT
jgi:hypothetical protein